MRPATVHETAGAVAVQVREPGVEVTVYAVINKPPAEAGGVQATNDWPFALEEALTAVGEPGEPTGTTESDAAEAGPVPAEFVAVTVNE